MQRHMSRARVKRQVSRYCGMSRRRARDLASVACWRVGGPQFAAATCAGAVTALQLDVRRDRDAA